MNKDIYFGLFFDKEAHSPQKGVIIRIPSDPNRFPGKILKEMTSEARNISRHKQIKLITEMLVSPLPGFDLRNLEDYLWSDGTLNNERLYRHLETYVSGGTPHRFQPKMGVPVVTEEEFIGRSQTLKQLQQALEMKHSCHLRAPRRYGKTSLLVRLTAQLKNAVLLEVSDVGSLLGFLKRMLKACISHPTAWSTLQKLPEYQSWAITSNRSRRDAIFNREFAELADSPSNPDLKEIIMKTMTALALDGIILLIDEFSMFLREMNDRESEKLHHFLDSFKNLRMNHSKPLVTVFAGSSGLSTYIQLYGMKDLFSDLTTVDVPPVTAKEAQLLAEELFYGMDKLPSPDILNLLVNLTGGDDSIPYFVQALTHYSSEQSGHRRVIQDTDIETAYYDRLLGPSGNIFFRDFILRERTYPEEYRSSASSILKCLSQAVPKDVTEIKLRKLCQSECSFEKLMTFLEEDYDLVRSSDRWRMRSRVIADRWRLGEPWLTIGGN